MTTGSPSFRLESSRLKPSNFRDEAPPARSEGALIGSGALCCLWLGLLVYGWARWGDVTVDSGREMYVPAVLAQGRVLYRDVWYLYGPGAPYFNSLLLRVFGVHLTPLYIAGALGSLVCALALFRTALYFAPAGVALATAYIVLIQSFVAGIFNYPLPYSYASVYGSAAACLFLLYAVRAAFEPSKTNLFWAGTWSAVALLVKLEFGVACFIALAVLQSGLALRQRSWRGAFINLAPLAPALLVCLAVIAWMVSIRGASFITQENFMSWPTAYFMQRYGAYWLRFTGYDLSLGELRTALVVTLRFVVFWFLVRLWLHWLSRRVSLYNVGIAAAVAAAGAVYWTARPEQLSLHFTMLLFPRPMVFILALASIAAAFAFWRSRWSARALALLLVLSFGPLLAFRVLFRMIPHGYAIYYNGPSLLAFFLLLTLIALPAADTIGAVRRRAAAVLLSAVAAWVTAQLYPGYEQLRRDRARFETERGTIYLHEAKFAAWTEAVAFMREANRAGEAVMSIPEDTALYFFSGANAPTRVFAFTPGMLAPGRMTDQLLDQMERAPVRYLIWSNRRFPEYGVPEFGVDYDVEFGDYLRRNYRPARQFGASDDRPDAWRAVLWERQTPK